MKKVLEAFAKSSSPNKAIDAEKVLDKMIESYNNGNRSAKPTLRTYSIVLNACAYSNASNQDKAATFKLARRCFKEILNGKLGQHPDSLNFSLFMMTCQNLVPPGTKRDQLLASVFDECCKRGLVDVNVVVNIKSLSPTLKKQLLQGTNLEYGHFIQIEDIPYQWRVNVRERRKKD